MVEDRNWKSVALNCTKCKDEFRFDKESDKHDLPINQALVVGAYTAGIGYTGLKAIMNSVEIKFLSDKTYKAAEVFTGERIRAQLEDEFAKNIALEKTLAVQRGDVITVDGISHPFITVVVDGGGVKEVMATPTTRTPARL